MHGVAMSPKAGAHGELCGLLCIRAALEAGADEYVMKPFDRETLHIKLQLVGVA